MDVLLDAATPSDNATRHWLRGAVRQCNVWTGTAVVRRPSPWGDRGASLANRIQRTGCRSDLQQHRALLPRLPLRQRLVRAHFDVREEETLHDSTYRFYVQVPNRHAPLGL